MSETKASQTLGLLYGVKNVRARILKRYEAAIKLFRADPIETCMSFSFSSQTNWNGESSDKPVKFWQCEKANKNLADMIPSTEKNAERCHFDVHCKKSENNGKVTYLTDMVYAVSCKKENQGCPAIDKCAGQGEVSKVYDLEKPKASEGIR